MNEHYKLDGIEAIDVIDQVTARDGIDKAQAYCVGNAIKYLVRLGAKESASVEDDLFKAENYLHRARTGQWIGDDDDRQN